MKSPYLPHTTSSLSQARALTPQQAETEKIRFLIGTQSLKQTNNQVHLLEFDDENSTLKTNVYHHPRGEIWNISSSPLKADTLATCFNTVTDEISCSIKTAIYRIPDSENLDKIEDLQLVTDLDSVNSEVKCTEFHPGEETKALSVCESQIYIWDLGDGRGKSILTVGLEGKSNAKYTMGKWNPLQNCNQVSWFSGRL